MELIRYYLCIWKAHLCTAPEKIAHVHYNVFDIIGVIKLREIFIKTFGFSVRKYVNDLFFS